MLEEIAVLGKYLAILNWINNYKYDATCNANEWINKNKLFCFA